MDSIEKLAQGLYKENNSIIVYKNGIGYLVNKKKDEKINVRSISKTILALACGIVIGQYNDFDEYTYIYPIIKNKISLKNKKNERYLKQIKVKHLLTHTVGYRDILLMSEDINKFNIDNLLNEVINYPIYYRPGTHFLYSNASYYILSATLQEFIGTDLFKFIDENLFDPLNIKNAKADKYGAYLAGATKFYLSTDNLLNIGKLLLNNGKFEGRQIISQAWIEKMKNPLFKNDFEIKKNYLSEDYYGYSLWISKNGITFASGTGGQLIVLMEKSNTIIVTTNNESSNKDYKIKSDIDNIIEILNRG
ncbi:serine hydrolase [Anaerococcus sp. mt242]|uniref:serine hydrolase domain-containing protein n=1 Tax=Anaerococcus sp. mt242 TaxID=2661917 RepID=UPI0019334506|nr:serine hydrolase [Anaerococcus sp. mt242]MBM0045816.1 serine hydrolase [Anaerococcus sp. mt242]